MSFLKQQLGFSIVELSIVVLVIGLVGFAGYTIYSRGHDIATNQSAIATDVPTAPQIHATNDLNKAEQMLEEMDSSSSADEAQLDAQVSAF